MMKAKFVSERFQAANEGAVAPLVAVVLFCAGSKPPALPSIINTAWSRSPTPRFRNAADQAALAAGGTTHRQDQCSTRYAQEAAPNLVSNAAGMANDGATPLITDASVIFYADKAKTTVVTPRRYQRHLMTPTPRISSK